jgi:hypothetical protein
MIEKLHSPDYFCVSETGDFAGLRDDCYWGLPSIAASDASFPALGYWRGYIWAPMIQLVWWGLDNPRYENITQVALGRKALVKQSYAMELSTWRNSGHICENYCPAKHATGTTSWQPNATDAEARCCGGNFYHWGALTGFVGLLEAGLY